MTFVVEAKGLTNLHKMPKLEAQFRHVLMGRADLSVNATPLGVAYYLKKLNKPTDALVKTQVKLLEFPLYIACSKKIPDSVINKWQRAFEKVKQLQHIPIIKLILDSFLIWRRIHLIFSLLLFHAKWH